MKLNLGAGDQKLRGWTNVDVGDLAKPIDLSDFPWPWEDNSIDEILASHILEHFTRLDGVEFLQECYRILKPGGVIHITVPDMDIFIDCHVNKSFLPVHDFPWKNLNACMGGGDGEPDPRERHYYMYCWASLAYTLEKLGFVKVKRRLTPKLFDNTKYQSFSLYVDAVKP